MDTRLHVPSAIAFTASLTRCRRENPSECTPRQLGTAIVAVAHIPELSLWLLPRL